MVAPILQDSLPLEHKLGGLSDNPAPLVLHSYSLGLDAREARKRKLRAWKEFSRATETRLWS